MTKPNDGGPAFPVKKFDNDIGDYYLSSGMTLRDYFAAKAMQGMITSLTEFDPTLLDGKSIIVNRPRDISELAYTYADTMLAHRDKKDG